MKRNVLLLCVMVLYVFSLASTLSMIMDVTGPFSQNFNPFFSGGTNYSARGFIYETYVKNSWRF
ncbi:MAG: hypothetical protein WAO60_07150 [Defluviitoga tunisiensis]